MEHITLHENGVTTTKPTLSLRWRHNGRDSVSNHQPHDCLLNRLFRLRSKKTSKLRVTGLCAGNSPGTSEFPAQMASYAENVSIWWRHHVIKMLRGQECLGVDTADRDVIWQLWRTMCTGWYEISYKRPLLSQSTSFCFGRSFFTGSNTTDIANFNKMLKWLKRLWASVDANLLGHCSYGRELLELQIALSQILRDSKMHTQQLQSALTVLPSDCHRGH